MYDNSSWVYLFATSFFVAIAQNLAKRFIECSDKKKKNTKPNHTFRSVEIRISILFQFLKNLVNHLRCCSGPSHSLRLWLFFSIC